ncbi:hypothetical protein K505DRAFT_338992 [Melanomma pulvis-pyrius CBS 109.77]|uniref:Protein kinase domain-containing protein n=1 Tax=Melanomma pulvis-pyrius CBS 109.77 TaxID=1314802 RepID=A0A6A6X762_9PLEO|nr:hypothetical protein K505DRAFT_338992 [Melanomma pulvis-pyrius CBS 109.77]
MVGCLIFNEVRIVGLGALWGELSPLLLKESTDINRLIEEHHYTETKVLFVHWGAGDHVDAFREDSQRLQDLFLRLNYPFVKEYTIPEVNSEAELEREIWTHLNSFQNMQSVLILYYGGHGERGGRGRWVAHDEIGREPAIEWQSIQRRLSRFRGRLLVIIDACFAGSAMRSADDYKFSLCNMVGLQRSSRGEISVVPENVELWLATSFHGQTPLREPTFTQAIVRTLNSQLGSSGASITVSRAHKLMIEMGSGNELQCQPIYQPSENKYQKSIEIHHFDVASPPTVKHDPSTMIELRLKLNALDADTMPSLIQWLVAHPTNVISQECQNIETCIRAAHQYVSLDIPKPSSMASLTPFHNLSDSLKQRTFDAYHTLTQSAIGLLSVDGQASTVRSSPVNQSKTKIASRELEGAWTRFKTQMQQNILLGLDNNKEEAVLRMMEDPEMNKMGLSQILHMRLLAMRNDEHPAHILKPPTISGSAESVSEGSLIYLYDGIHAVEYKTYSKDIKEQARTIHERRIDRLAKVLKEASSQHDSTSPTEFLTLNCLGYFHEPTKYRFGLKFELPRRHNSTPESISLWRALKSGKKFRLPLQQRLSLARQIGQALLNWHLAGWHHQEISSRNILFFSTPRSPEPDFTTPYLCGFDFSRKSGTISLMKDAKDMEFSVYRHPERQFDTTSAHKLRHDIYSFGVVLLDLGLWDDPDESWKSSVKVKPVDESQAIIVYRKLRSFIGRLSFYVGGCYTQAVQNCLDDEQYSEASDRETTEIFINKVLNKLHNGEGL